MIDVFSLYDSWIYLQIVYELHVINVNSEWVEFVIQISILHQHHNHPPFTTF